MEVGAQRRQIRGAIWLYMQLVIFAVESAEDWWVVCDGAQISDERLAVYLDVGAARVRKWRDRLEQLGLIRTEVVRPLNWKFWVKNPEKIDQ